MRPMLRFHRSPARCGSVLVALIAAAVTATTFPAQAGSCDTVDDRPSIGLALSGGGARGAAHVGVLRVLEELNVPIDCIAGTSMGAIVGGLYAAGQSAEELQAVIESVDWEDAFRDDPPRDQLSFRRKQDDYDFLADFELGLRGGQVKLPLGVVQGQKLTLLLRRLNTRARHVDDFDRLPIPFRAVATDAVTGGAIILGRGDLSKAQRASMAAPGVFSPVTIDDRVLIDGGISNNLPINVVRAMGADIVIAVDISFPLLARDDLNSAFALSNQALTILIRREAARQLGTLNATDVAIVPALGKYSSADFANLSDAIEIGFEAASAQRDDLAALAVGESAYRDWRTAHRMRSQSDAPRVRRITLNDDSRLSRDSLSTLLSVRAGDVYDPEALEADIAALYGLNVFESVDYTISGDQDVDIDITTRQKSWGPNFLNFGLRLVDDFERSSQYSLGVRYTRTQVNPLGAEWRIDLQFGNNPLLLTEFYQPISKTSRFFIAPRLRFEEFDGDFFDTGGERLAQYRVELQDVGLDLGLAINNRSELRLGAFYVDGKANLIVGDPALGSFDVNSGRVQLLYRYDSINNTAFPTSGQRITASLEGIRAGLGADRNRNRGSLEWLGARTFGQTTVLAGIRTASNFASEGGVEDEFELGGLFNLSGFRTGELRGQHLALLSLSGFQNIRFGDRLPLPVYAGLSLEAGNVWNDSEDVSAGDLRFAGSLFLGADTPVGPAYLAYGLAEDGKTAAYFFLGQRFGATTR
ncbi:MAG: patatin-like phospholipase family protein [Pseudomonadota bacterium]